MKFVSVAEAKNHLSELLAQVAAGEQITVTRYGKPVGHLRGIDEGSAPGDEAARVHDVFQRLAQLRRGVRLDGDLKKIARSGLD